MKKLLLFFLFTIFLSSSVTGLSLTGGPMPADVFYEYGTQKEFTYRFGTTSHTQDYAIDFYSKANVDLRKYITVEPNYFKQVPPGSGVDFKVKLDFIDEEVTPGRHDILVIVKETEAAPGSMVGALAQVAVRFRVTSIYPTEFLNWDFSLPDSNIDEDVDIKTSITNWGEPYINDAFVNFKIYNSNSELIKEFTSESMAVASKETTSTTTTFSTQGFLPDDYSIRAKISYAGIEEFKEKKFRVGSKNILINNMTTEFMSEAINIVEVDVESGWNDDIKQVKGIVSIIDDGVSIHDFPLQEVSLKKWGTETMRGYFETFGIPNDDYEAIVTLSYDDERSTKNFDVRISDEGTAQVTDQNPLNITQYLTVQNFIFVALIIILGMNVWYLIDRRKR